MFKMQSVSISEISDENLKCSDTVILTPKAVEHYLKEKLEHGVSSAAVAKYRTSLQKLLQWSERTRILTAEQLQDWRQDLKDHGYSKDTIQAHVKIVNDFLRTTGQERFCIQKPLRIDLRGKTYGYLTVIEPTEKRSRRDVVWRCSCRCGREAEAATTMLTSGKTMSCGCLNVQILQYANRYVEGTSLRQSLEDRVFSTNTASGYTGVHQKRGKWQAFITYKGIRYHLGTYTKMEDAVKARARAKEMVMEDAARLYEEYADCYEDTPSRPEKPERYTPIKQKSSEQTAMRSDNTSGYTGISKRKDKWSVSISLNGKRYALGVYKELEDAIAVRRQAEAYIRVNDLESLKMICTSDAVHQNI